MSRAVDIAVRYVLSTVDRGTRQAVTLSQDMARTTRTTQQQMDAALRATSAEWKATSRVAATEQRLVGDAAAKASVRVNRALESEIEKLRKAGVSYRQIGDAAKGWGYSAQQSSAAIKRSADTEIAAINRTIAARERLRKTVGLGPSAAARASGLGRVETHGVERGALRAAAGHARSGVSYLGAGLVGGLAGYASVQGVRNAVDFTKNLALETRTLTALTGMDAKQAEAWVAVTQARGISARQFAVTLKTLSASASSAMGNIGKASDKTLTTLALKTESAVQGNKKAVGSFQALGISYHDVESRQHNVSAIYDLVTGRLAKMRDGIEKTAISNELLGKSGSSTLAVNAAFKTLGITQDELKAHSHDLSGLLGLVADKLDKMPPGAEKTAIAAKLLGRNFTQLMPLLTEGSKGMAKQREEATALGVTLGGNAAENAHKLEEASIKLKFAQMGLQVQFAEHVAPALITVTTEGIKLFGVLRQDLGPAVHFVSGEVKDASHWLDQHKTVLHALEGTLIGVGGAYVGLKVIGGTVRLVRGLTADVKAGASMFKSLAHPVSTVKDLFGQQESETANLTRATNALADANARLAKSFETVSGASRTAAGSEAIAAETGTAASLAGGASSPAGVILPRSATATAVAGETTALAGASTLATTEGEIQKTGMLGMLFGRQGVQTLTSRLSTLGSGVMRGAGVGMMGVMGAQLAGGAIGGSAGRTVSSVGTAAGIGAGVGMILGPEGAAAGAGIGAAVVGLQKLFGDSGRKPSDAVKQLADQMQRAAAVGDSGKLTKLAGQADKLASGFHSAAGGAHALGLNAGFDRSATQLQKLAVAARATSDALGQQQITGFTSALAQVKFPSGAAIVTDFTRQFSGAAPKLRNAAAAATLELAKGLEEKGKLPRDSVARMIKQMEGQFPGLATYLRGQGLASDQQLASALKLTRSQATLQDTINKLEQQFGYVPQNAKVTSDNMVSQFQGGMTSLKQVMATGSKQAKEAALKEYGQLRDQASTYFANLTTNVSQQQASLTGDIKSGSASATAAAETNWQKFQTQIQNAVNQGVITVSQGNQELRTELNNTLKTLGQKQLAGTAISSTAKGKTSALTFQVGGRVPGDSTRDGTLALLSGDEFVLTGDGQRQMEAEAPGLLSHIEQTQLPHFRKGGSVSTSTTIPTPQVVGGGTIGREAQGALDKAAKASNDYLTKALSKAGSMTGGSSTTGGGNSGNEALGRRMMLAYGAGKWGPGQWPSLKALWTQESGWNANAVNPSSGAYGIPQSLGHGHPYPLGQPRPQIAWGLNYIDGRYGSPAAAEAHERRFNWYRRGGRIRHFQDGGFASDAAGLGWPVKSKSSSRASTPRQYIVPGSSPPRLETVTPAEYRHQELMYRLHKKKSGKTAGHFGGLSFTGPVSTFGPPGEAAGQTAYGGTDAVPGIAINPGPGINDWNTQRAQQLRGKTFLVSVPGGHRAFLDVIDKGPRALATSGAEKGRPRMIDITGAGASKMGISGAFPTDAVGTAREWVGSKPSGLVTTKGATSYVAAGKGLLGGFDLGYNYGLDPTQSGVVSPSQAFMRALVGSSLKASRATSSGSASGSSGTVGGSSAGGVRVPGASTAQAKKVNAMLSYANRVASMGIPYGFAGHSGGWGIASSEDCSSYASKILHAGGYLKAVQTTSTLPGQPGILGGAGRWVTLKDRPLGGQQGHVITNILGHWFESGGRRGPWGGGKGPSRIGTPSSSYLSSFGRTLHPAGLRRGGRLRRFSTGGRVAQGDPAADAAYTTPRLGGLPRFRKGGSTSARAKIHTPTLHLAKAGRTVLPALPSSLNFSEIQSVSDAVAEMPVVAVDVGVKTTRAALAKLNKSLATIASTSNDHKLSGAYKLLSGALSNVSTVSYGTLQRTAAGIEREIKKLGSPKTTAGTRELTRLKNALQLVDYQMGQRVGNLVRVAENQSSALTTAQTALQRLMTRKGIDQASAQGTQMLTAYEDQAVKVLQSTVSRLQQAYRMAQKAGDAKAVSDIGQKLAAAMDNLDQEITNQIEAYRNQVEAAAQAIVDQATHQTTLDQAGQTSLDLQQQLAGTSGTPGAAAQMSAYINQKIVPDLQKQLATLQAQQAAAKSVGDQTLADQIGESIANKQNDILQAQLDAQNAIKTAAQQTAQNTNTSGTLGVSFQGQQLPDLAGMLNGV